MNDKLRRLLNAIGLFVAFVIIVLAVWTRIAPAVIASLK
jgi:hypothetical protein